MKKTLLIGLAIATTAISFNALAAVDAKYPAANFEPSVIYVDKEASPSAAEPQSEFDAKYPAASFQPKVIYPEQGAETAATETSSAVEASKDETDPKYPAAYYQPKVIYP